MEIGDLPPWDKFGTAHMEDTYLLTKGFPNSISSPTKDRFHGFAAGRLT